LEIDNDGDGLNDESSASVINVLPTSKFASFLVYPNNISSAATNLIKFRI